MTPFEFKIVKNSLGLTAQDVSQRMGVSLRSAQRMESLSPKAAITPKPDVQAWALGEWGKFADTIGEQMEHAERLQALGRPLEIEVYRDELQCMTETGYSLSQNMALAGHIAMMCTLADFDWVLVEK